MVLMENGAIFLIFHSAFAAKLIDISITAEGELKIPTDSNSAGKTASDRVMMTFNQKIS